MNSWNLINIDYWSVAGFDLIPDSNQRYYIVKYKNTLLIYGDSNLRSYDLKKGQLKYLCKLNALPEHHCISIINNDKLYIHRMNMKSLLIYNLKTNQLEPKVDRIYNLSNFTCNIINDKIVFYGGISYNRVFFGGASYDKVLYENCLWLYDCNSNGWSQIKWEGDTPTRRYRHKSHIYNNCLYIFGGETHGHSKLQKLSDLWKFDFTTKKWTLIKNLSLGDLDNCHYCFYDTYIIFIKEAVESQTWNSTAKNYIYLLYYYDFIFDEMYIFETNSNTNDITDIQIDNDTLISFDKFNMHTLKLPKVLYSLKELCLINIRKNIGLFPEKKLKRVLTVDLLGWFD